MRIKASGKIISISILVLASVQPVPAHHSFAAEFDVSRPVHLEGVVVQFEWVNPHSWLHIDVTGKDGNVVRWRIEGGAPSALLRRGWNRNSLPAGTKVTVEGFQAKDGSSRANASDIVFPDGRKLFLGTTRVRAPKDDSEEIK